MTFVKPVGGRKFMLRPHSCYFVWERAGHSLEEEAAGENCHKRLEQHDASLSSGDNYMNKALFSM
jgi:hypothetical protein